ncbi:MAG: helix-turn-helix transcriptional regulator [Phycisphaerales bacterium]|nr:helix-turn-helix transcriptional regulator [Phycisphaerales bacterium]
MATAEKNVPAGVAKLRDALDTESTAMHAAIAIAQLDPHSWQDLEQYRKDYVKASKAGDTEVQEFLIQAMAEVFHAPDPAKARTLDAIEAELRSSEAGAKAFAALDERDRIFMDNLATLRSKHGLDTQKKLADAAGVHVNTIRSIEHKRRCPQFATLKKLAKALGVPVTKLAPA